MEAKTENEVGQGDILARQKMFIEGGYPNLAYLRPWVELPVLYEDDFMAIVYKPANVSVYNIAQMRKSKGNHSVLGTLPFVLTPPRAGIPDPLILPQLCHRLDQPTSGLMVAVKTKAAASGLSYAFESRTAEKTYTAVVASKERLDLRVPPAGAEGWHQIDHAVDDKASVTLWQATYLFPGPENTHLFSMTLRPRTGRRHQLRKHMSEYLKSSIVGDSKYGGRELDVPTKSLMLSATRLRVPHPVFGPSNPAPPDLDEGFAACRSTSSDGRVWVEVKADPPDWKLAKWHSRWLEFERQEALNKGDQIYGDWRGPVT
jgi:23S rRNA-/tRNA-specific pseudouridylate synthase